MGGDQATKIATILGYDGHTRVDAVGFSGGIWVYWKTDLVTVSPIIKHNQHITMEITRVGATPWYFSAVYASPDPTKRRDLWEELNKFASNNSNPWLIAGDFNETRFPSKRNTSCRETTRRSALFNEWVNDLELIEVEFSGAAHTWARGRSPETRQSGRLDRTLCNSAWAVRFDKASMKHLTAIHSDHCPIFISPNGFVPLQATHCPFRFQAAWMSHENFREFVDKSWEKNAPLIPALANLSSKLQNWNRNTFGNVYKQKRMLMARIGGIQKNLATRVDRGLIKLELKLRRDLDEILEREEMIWYQKSRIAWLKDGDRNTTFFHLSTIVRRWKNKVAALKNNEGQWLHDKLDIQENIVEYFTHLFTEEGEPEYFDVTSDIFPELSSNDWSTLTKYYTRTEIDLVVNEMATLKAPGPDGFQVLFYKKNWDLISVTVYNTILPILEGKGFPTNLNDTFIALIPKVDHPELASQF
ncbi:uncharacterized protein LOC110722546 [Chenopodium quinoa]|uniref:uncharacterized protein LOC110722546 n=1 Tax=Chenopodium quinoa TaxID=63459 RepID=UPI000B7981AA|nr:uncharacterized protein LOC110722546 [Chenopodium quinoa]